MTPHFTRTVTKGCQLFWTNPKSSEVVFKAPENISKILIFFGGDVQNIEEDMNESRNKKYIEWSLESIVSKLAETSSSTLVMAVKPNRMEMQTFSCYDNFVQSNDIGVPSHNFGPELYAIRNLHDLLENLQSVFSVPLLTLPVKVVGFSKGVVCLNQILIDLYKFENKCDADDKLGRWFSNVETMAWLDGGHNGGKMTWITDENILLSLVNLSNIKVDIRVTPYQIDDHNRPWIKEEESLFYSILHKLNGKSSDLRLRRHVYFKNEKISLLNHFKVIDTLFDKPLL